MSELCVRTRFESAGQAIVDVSPMVRADVLGSDPERFNLIDGVERRLDFRPSGEAQEDFPARGHMRDGRTRLAWTDGTQDVDPAFDRAIVVRRPPHEGEDASRIETDGAPAAAVNCLLSDAAEADPALDPAFDPRQIDACSAGHLCVLSA